jgi:molybdenum cofactor biosynthesis enzyme
VRAEYIAAVNKFSVEIVCSHLSRQPRQSSETRRKKDITYRVKTTIRTPVELEALQQVTNYMR